MLEVFSSLLETQAVRVYMSQILAPSRVFAIAQEQRLFRQPASCIGQQQQRRARSRMYAASYSVRLAPPELEALVQDAVVWSNQHGMVGAWQRGHGRGGSCFAAWLPQPALRPCTGLAIGPSARSHASGPHAWGVLSGPRACDPPASPGVGVRWGVLSGPHACARPPAYPRGVVGRADAVGLLFHLNGPNQKVWHGWRLG